MPSYAVRITYDYKTFAPIIKLWAEKCEKVAVYEHVGEKTGKTHIHLALWRTSVDKKQLRNIAMKYLDVKGNERCSMKALETDWTLAIRYYVYMTKGKHDPSFLKEYTQEEADGWKAQWKAPELEGTLDFWDNMNKEFESYCKMPLFENSPYYNWLNNPNAVGEPPKDDRLELVIHQAYKYVWTKLKSSRPQFKAWVESCWRTYAHNHGISIPKKLDWW